MSEIPAPQAASIDERIDSAFEPISTLIENVVFYSVNIGEASLPLIVVWLVAAAFIFTFRFRFINVRGFSHSLKLVRGKFSDPKDRGEVSHFGALATALSGTVGLGNIAGVAVAITLGGPGATFWMIFAGVFSMTTKFVECTLGVKYRIYNEDGTVSGGPMHYLSRGLAAERGWPMFGKVLAVAFAIFCIGGSLGGGNAFQSNQAYAQFRDVTGGDDSFVADTGWAFGLVMAILVGIVIIGGIKSIARVTTKLVPAMAVIYVSAALIILGANAGQVPTAFRLILEGAFTPEGIAGGFIGVLIVGFQRAAFSNEAGIGSAAIAHSAVRTERPVTEGFVALLEPFIDTVVVCTMTALVIIITGVYTAGESDGVALTSDAFATNIGWFPNVLAVAVILFAFSTMLAWSYYGTKSATYLFGENRYADLGYKFVFLGFVVLGASSDLGSILAFSDSMIFAMALPNLIGLYLLSRVVSRELSTYNAALKSGEIKQFDRHGNEVDTTPKDLV
jgi:alanine or glycine:cation symporter, AGCS family